MRTRNRVIVRRVNKLYVSMYARVHINAMLRSSEVTTLPREFAPHRPRIDARASRIALEYTPETKPRSALPARRIRESGASRRIFGLPEARALRMRAKLP